MIITSSIKALFKQEKIIGTYRVCELDLENMYSFANLAREIIGRDLDLADEVGDLFVFFIDSFAGITIESVDDDPQTLYEGRIVSIPKAVSLLQKLSELEEQLYE